MITQTTWKKTSVTTPHLPLKLPLFGPPHPLEISVAIRGGDVDIFWKYTLHL